MKMEERKEEIDSAGIRKKRWIARICIGAMSFLLCGGVAATYIYMKSRIPETLRLSTGEEHTIDFSLPVSGTVYSENDEELMSFPVTSQVVVSSDEISTYKMDLKLLGFLPIQEIAVDVSNEMYLIPMGVPIGIYMETKGSLVIGTGQFKGQDGMVYAPAQYLLKEGDYILAVDNVPVNDKDELIRRIEECNGEEMELLIQRKEEQFAVRVLPKRNQDGVYKLGIWIRDNAQGVGTMTFLAKNGEYGALGHGINDADTGTLMELAYGELYNTDIIGVRKGSVGEPGELTGLICYQEENQIGTITSNTGNGIFGCCDAEFMQNLNREGDTLVAIPVGMKQEIQLGEATILSTIQGATEQYQIVIEKINYNGGNSNREIELQVVDERLLEQTGGIIQGMFTSYNGSNNRKASKIKGFLMF